MGQGGEVSATAFDVQDVMDNPVIVKIKEDLQAKKITIDEAEGLFKTAILHEPTLDDNTYVMFIRTGGTTVNQAFQTCITRGAVFDLNNSIMPNPIEPGFAEGITNIADAVGETKAAGKALISNGKALEDSEWFHRKLHIATNVFTSIDYYHDCGTKITIPIKVLSNDHLRSMMGKYVMVDDKPVLLNRKSVKQFKKGDVLNVRSIAFCRHSGSGVPIVTGKQIGRAHV